MSLRVLVLTTQTPHHIYFVQKLLEMGHSVSVLCEELMAGGGAHANDLEAERQDYERSKWFRDDCPRLSDLCPTKTSPSVNATEALVMLRQAPSDVAISFGTRLIKDDALRLLPEERWNLHGGDPQKYRGLDSHLWALYHDDHESLVTTVHTLAPALDAGAIVAGSRIDLSPAPELHMLRALNTDLAIRLVAGSLAHLEAVGSVPRMPQATVGRYYSALPKALWTKCAKSYAAAVNSWTEGT